MNNNNINTDQDDDETKSHPPNEAFEISDSENSVNNNNEEVLNRTAPYIKKNSIPSIDSYKKKIQEQASRLQQNEMYIALCEKKIKMYNSNQKFPITETDLQINVQEEDNNSVIKCIEGNQSFISFARAKKRNPIADVESITLFMNEYEEIKRNLIVYKNDLLSCHEIMNKMKAENESMRQELIKKENELKENKDKIKEYTMKYNDILIEKGNISSKNYMTETKLNEILKEYNKLSEDMKVIINERNEILNQLHSCKSLLNSKNEEIDDIKNLLHKSKEQYENEKSQLVDHSYKLAENQFNIKQEELYSAISEKDNTIRELNDSNCSQEKEIIKLNNYIKQLEDKYEKLIEKSNYLEETYENEKKEHLCVYDEIKDQNENLTEENETLKKNIKNIQEQFNMLSKEDDMLKKEYSILKEEHKAIKKENEKMSKIIVSLEIDNNKLSNAQKSLNNEIKFIQSKSDGDYTKLQKEIDSLSEQNEQIKLSYNKALSDNNELIQKQNSLLNDIHTVKGRLTDYEIQIKKYIETLSDKEHESEMIKKESEEIKKKMINTNQTLNSLKGELDTKNADNNSLLQERQKLINEYNTVKLANNDKEHMINDLLEQISEIKEKIRNNENNFYLTSKFQQFITKPSLSVSLFLDITEEQIEALLNKLTELSNQIVELQKTNNNLHFELQSIHNENDKLVSMVNEAKLQSKTGQEKLQKITKEHNDLLLKLKDQEGIINSLSKENANKDNMISECGHKSDYLEEVISFYELTKSQIENILVEMSRFLRNPNLKFLTTELIKKNYDLITLGRDISKKKYDSLSKEASQIEKDDVQMKISDIFFIIDNINKEFKIEQRLYDMTKDFPFTNNTTLKRDLVNAKDQLRESYSKYQQSYYIKK